MKEVNEKNLKKAMLVNGVLTIPTLFVYIVGGILPVLLLCIPMYLYYRDIPKSRHAKFFITLFILAAALLFAGLVSGTEYEITFLEK